MKNYFLLSVAGLAFLFAGCTRHGEKNVVKETYIHKYGVPIHKEDWAKNGKDGQVAQLLSDGVIVTRTYEKGILNGPVAYTFPNSSLIQSIENYDHGTLVSKIEHYPSGTPQKESIFEEGKLAKLTCWYEEGTPFLIENYMDDKLVSGEYRSLLNTVESKVQDGCGLRIMRGEDGKLLSKDTIAFGTMVESVTYFSNEDPAVITPYENGKINGMRLTFLQGGLPNTVEQWIQNVQEGITVAYLNGEKYAEIPYVNGEKSGVESRFKDGHILVEEVSWKNGVQHGPRRLIADEAERTEWYHQGELVSRATYDRLNLPR